MPTKNIVPVGVVESIDKSCGVCKLVKTLFGQLLWQKHPTLGSIVPLLMFKKQSCFMISSPRAESARAVNGRRCPHSGKGEDFLTGQLNFFTKTAVTLERKVKKSGN